MIASALSGRTVERKIKLSLEYDSGKRNHNASWNDDEYGDHVFYPLSPIQLTLYYSFLPEVDIT